MKRKVAVIIVIIFFIGSLCTESKAAAVAKKINNNIGNSTVEDNVAPVNEPTAVAEPTAIIEPSDAAEPIVTVEPTVKPVVTEIPVPETLRIMHKHNYVKESITGVSTKYLSLQKLRQKVKKYGYLYYEGMPFSQYKKAMDYNWKDCTDYKKKPTKININISNTMDYKKYVGILKKLSRYDGVYLYKIGESTYGRTLYAIDIDVKSTKHKDVIMLTGNVHARELAGGTFLVKELVDLVQKAQKDKKTMNMLSQTEFVAVPVVNVDGREYIIKHSKSMWKAYLNGTDGNRNFPGFIWGELLKGCKHNSTIKYKPGSGYYVGKYAGSNSETQALMKWIYHYTVIEKAKCLIDMHQQGRIVHAGKEWSSSRQQKNSQKLRTKIMALLNNKNNIKYQRASDEKNYGLTGDGSTITDYACTVAFGGKFSPAYGFCTLVNNRKEYPLLMLKNLSNVKFKIKSANTNFKAVTIEIGYGKQYYGNSKRARKLASKEYKKYHFDKLLESLPGMLSQ